MAATPTEPGGADAAGASLHPVARPIRVTIDVMLLVLGVLALVDVIRGVFQLFVFWVISFGVFPYARSVAHLMKQREAHWACLVLGVTIIALGSVRAVGIMPGVVHAMPSTSSVLLGVTLALAGATNVLYAGDPRSLRRLLLGVATLVAGGIWLWSALGE